MGLLDDAIREHLDLKRRRGADPAEVERAEREALGPVRRNRDASAVADPDDDLATGDPAYDEADEATFDAVGYDEADELSTGAAGHDQAREPSVGGMAYDQDEDEDWAYEDGQADAPMGETPPVSPEQREPGRDPSQPAPRRPPRDFDEGDEPFADESKPAEGETTEYNVDDALGAENEESEDVLEETPEFLQDTPDHDRLWFEQRPPRDFDFDG